MPDARTEKPKAFVFKGDRLGDPDGHDRPHFVLGLRLRLTTSDEGGRSKPIGPFSREGFQYRPDWGFDGLNHPHEMCAAPVL